MNIEYLAGLIDGEGYLGIMKQIRKDRPSIAYRPILQISNTYEKLLIKIRTYYGGGIYEIKRLPNKKWKKQYVWHCGDTELMRILPIVEPFLIVKKEQANIIMEFIQNKKSFKRHSLGQGLGSSPLSKEETDYRESLYRKVKILNRRGSDAQ